MKIYYNFALQQVADYQEKYQSVIDLLKEAGHQLTQERLAQAIAEVAQKNSPLGKRKYIEVTNAIQEADLCIFDMTVKSVALGHQYAHALHHSKPTLIISDKTKSDALDTLYVGGCKSTYLTVKDYQNEQEMLKIIEKFLDRNSGLFNKRMNLFVGRVLWEYVNWKAYHDKQTKTDVIHGALLKEMENNAKYQSYLDGQEIE